MKPGSLVRFAFLVTGIFLIVWSLQAPVFFDAAYGLRGAFAFPFSAGIAMLVLSLTLNRFGFYLGLNIAGHAALLQTIDAGKLLHYQHYRPFDSSLAAISFLALQTLIVTFGLRSHRIVIADWIHKNWKVMLPLGLMIIPITTAVSEDPGYYAFEISFASLAALIQAGNLFLIVRQIHPGFFLQRFHHWITDAAGRDNFKWIAALWVTFIGVLLSLFVYEKHPHVNDEVAYLFQARILATGQLTIQAPPVPDAFELYLFQYSNGRLLVVPPPGWAAILAAGVWIKAPWVINPLLAGANILLIYFVLQQLYDRRLARIAVFLLCFSPWFVFMSMNFMTHQWSTMCALISVAALIQSRRHGNSGWAFLSGLFIGIQSLIRPLDGVILGLLIGLWSLGFGGKRLKFGSIVALGAGTLIAGSLIFPYNKYFTGDPFRYPVNAYNERLFGENANAYGFGKDHGMNWPLDPLPGHGPLDAIINSQLNSSQIHIELFGWSIGSLCFILFFLLYRGPDRRDYPLFAALITVYTAYFFYYFSGGPDFAARYWFLMLIPLVALTVRGMDVLQSKINTGGLHIFVAVLVLTLITAVNYFPWRSADKYYRYLRMSPEICSLLPEKSQHGDLVLVDGEWFPDYSSAMACNPLNFDSGTPVFARDRGTNANAVLKQHYPGRRIWIVEGPSKTGAGYRISQILPH